MFLYIKRNKSGFAWIFLEPKNCYWWFPMISGYGTENLLSMGFEILGLDFWSLIIMPWRRFGAHVRDFFRIDCSGLWSLFHVASVGVLVKFRKWEYNRKHFFLILCTSLLGLSECSACVRNQFGSLQEGSSQAFLIGVTLDFKLALRVVIVNYWGGSHKTLHFSKRVLLLFHSVKLCVLLCEAAYRLHVVC